MCGVVLARTCVASRVLGGVCGATNADDDDDNAQHADNAHSSAICAVHCSGPARTADLRVSLNAHLVVLYPSYTCIVYMLYAYSMYRHTPVYTN